MSAVVPSRPAQAEGVGRWVVIGCPGTRRIEELTAAVEARPRWQIQVWSWQDVLAGRVDWSALRALQSCWLRLESPGKDWEVEKALLKLGSAAPSEPGFDSWTASEIDVMPARPGIILAQHQWWRGWRVALQRIKEQVAEHAPHVMFTTQPDDAEVLFDKHACQRRLEFHGVPCPPSTGIITGGFEEIEKLMTQGGGWGRLFLKPCHGSSASGMVALEYSPRHGLRAQTTVTRVRDAGQSADRACLFNNRQVATLHDPVEIARLCDYVLRHRAYAQQWVPKAGWEGGRMDFRVVVVQGVARHVVPRLSQHPMTNLQLGGRRGDVGPLRLHMGEEAWGRLITVAEQAASAFPETLHVSLDIAATPGFRRFFVLEANAFGDFLPGLLWEGKTTYEWEMAAQEAQVSTSGA